MTSTSASLAPAMSVSSVPSYRLHPNLVSLLHREFARVHQLNAVRLKEQLEQTSEDAIEERKQAAHTSRIIQAQETQTQIPPPNPQTAASTSTSTSNPSLLTLRSLLQLSSPPSLPLDFRHLPTLWALDRNRRGAVSCDDFLRLIESSSALIREKRWHTSPHALGKKLQAHFLAQMYADMREKEMQLQQQPPQQSQSSTTSSSNGLEEKSNGTSTEPSKPGGYETPSTYISFTSWLLSLLVNDTPTHSFVHVGLRVLYFHRSSLELLWEVLRPFFLRPPYTVALANHDFLASTSDNRTQDIPIAGGNNSAPLATAAPAHPSAVSFSEFCSLSLSFNMVSASNSGLNTHSFQSFFDLLQHSAERAGLLDLDDEILDHYVPVAIVETLLNKVEEEFRQTMQRMGFPAAPSEIAAQAQEAREKADARVAMKEAKRNAAVKEQERKSQAESKAHHSRHQYQPSYSLQLSQHHHKTHSSIDSELFTLLPAPTPRSFVTPRNAAPAVVAVSTHPPFTATTSPAKVRGGSIGNLNASVVTGVAAEGGEKSTRVGAGLTTHRLRNIAEELASGGAAEGGLEVEVDPILQEEIANVPPANRQRKPTEDELQLPLHAIPNNVDFGSSGRTIISTDDRRTPEMLTPTSHSAQTSTRKPKRPPGVPSLTFAPSSHGSIDRTRSIDQPLSGHIGNKDKAAIPVPAPLDRTSSGSDSTAPSTNNNNGVHSHGHSNSVPSMPLTAVSIASTTVQGSVAGVTISRAPSSTSSSQNSSLLPTPLTSPNHKTYQAHLNANSRRSTGPLNFKDTLILPNGNKGDAGASLYSTPRAPGNSLTHPSEIGKAGVPALPLYTLHGSPARIASFGFTASPHHLGMSGISHRMQPQQQHLIVGHVSLPATAHPIAVTPHRPPFTPHRMNPQSSSRAISSRTADPHQSPLLVNGAGQITLAPPSARLDGPLPASHASLLRSASKLTAHVHLVHDVSTLNAAQVKALVQDGLDSDDDDDEEEGGRELILEQDQENLPSNDNSQLPLKPFALKLEEVANPHAAKPADETLAAPIADTTTVNAEPEVVELHRKKVRVHPPSASTQSSGKSPADKDRATGNKKVSSAAKPPVVTANNKSAAPKTPTTNVATPTATSGNLKRPGMSRQASQNALSISSASPASTPTVRSPSNNNAAGGSTTNSYSSTIAGATSTGTSPASVPNRRTIAGSASKKELPSTNVKSVAKPKLTTPTLAPSASTPTLPSTTVSASASPPTRPTVAFTKPAELIVPVSIVLPMSPISPSTAQSSSPSISSPTHAVPQSATTPTAANGANVHPFGATNSPGNRLSGPFSTQLSDKKKSSNSSSELISPAPRNISAAKSNAAASNSGTKVSSVAAKLAAAAPSSASSKMKAK